MSFFTHKIPIDWRQWIPGSYHAKGPSPKVWIALSFGGVCVVTLLRAIWRDYRTYMAYGPGELPYNFKGWLVSSVVMRPFGTDVFNTVVYDRNLDKRSWLPPDWPRRIRGIRPHVGPHPIPQRQTDQEGPIDIQLRLSESFAQLVAENSTLLQFKPSVHEGQATQSISITDNIPRTPIAQELLGEVCHIHAVGDHAVHVVLAPQDCTSRYHHWQWICFADLKIGKKVINTGWGQRHPLDGVPRITKRFFGWTLPKEYIMLYSPRSEEELQIVMEIVKASAGYMTDSQLASI